MKRGIPRIGGIPRPQPAGTRLPQYQPVAVVKTPVLQVPRRVLVPPKIAARVPVASKSTPRIIARVPAPQVIPNPVRKLQAPRQTFVTSRPSFGFTSRVPSAASIVTQVASPVVTIPASPVRVGNEIVMVPDQEIVEAMAEPVVVEAMAEPVVVEPIEEPMILEQMEEPVVIEGPLPRTPVIFPRRRFGYTDPRNELYNQPPTPIYNESVLLQSPSTGRPVILDVAVNPQPVVETQSGEHIVCDISLNVRDPPMSLVPNRIPRPVGFIRERRRRARKARGAVMGEDMIPLTPSSARDYPNTPLSALTRRRFSRRILEEGPTPAGFYKIVNTSKIRFPVCDNLDTSIEWEPENDYLNWIHLLSPFKETNLMTFSPEEVPITAYDDMDLIQFS